MKCPICGGRMPGETRVVDMVERPLPAFVPCSYGTLEFRVWECKSGACAGTTYFEPVHREATP